MLSLYKCGTIRWRINKQFSPSACLMASSRVGETTGVWLRNPKPPSFPFPPRVFAPG